jgi:putative DNA primase/helicase
MKSQPSEKDFTNTIDALNILEEAQTLLGNKSKSKKKAQKETEKILDEIADILEKVDFCALAGILSKEKLKEKHEVVLSVEQTLEKARCHGFDFAVKNDFIFVFNGEFWNEINRKTLKNFLTKSAKKLGVNELDANHFEFAEKLYKQFLESSFYGNFREISEEVKINLLNGTFVFNELGGKLREFMASDFVTYQLPFEYDKSADCPMFKRFLDEVLPEKELQFIVAEFFAYAFTKHLKLEKAAFFLGGGANGKSVLFEIIKALFGKQNFSSFSLADLMSENNRALIANKLLNYASEINALTTKDTFKNLVSIEPIQARLKYCNSFEMENYAKLCFNCNELPRDIDKHHAYFRRLLIIPFNVQIPEAKQDKELAKKIIEKELAGVFNWILEGLERLIKNKRFTESVTVTKEIESYQNDSDSVALFLKEFNFAHHPTKSILLKDIFNLYREFCSSDGYNWLNKQNFSRRLRNLHKYKIVRKNPGNSVYCEYKSSLENEDF